jgi:uncharacterized membrane protein YbhN (UPF0104 family)
LIVTTRRSMIPTIKDTDQEAQRPRRHGPLILGVALFAISIGLAVKYLIGQQGSLPAIDIRDWPLALGAAAALLGVMVINGVVLRDLVAHFGVRLPNRTWLALTLVGSLLNLVSPVRGGAALRAVYLKRIHGVPLSDVATVLVGSTVFSLAVSAALGAIAIAVLGFPGGIYGWIAFLSSAFIAAFLSVALKLSPPRVRTPNKVLIRISRAAEGWRSLGARPALLRRLFLWNTLAAFLHALAFLLAFRLVLFQGDWLVPVTSSAFARIGTLLAVTPAGLGVFEAFGVVSAKIVGAETGTAVLGVLTVRLIGAAVGIVGGLLMLPILMKDGATSSSRASSSSGSTEP